MNKILTERRFCWVADWLLAFQSAPYQRSWLSSALRAQGELYRGPPRSCSRWRGAPDSPQRLCEAAAGETHEPKTGSGRRVPTLSPTLSTVRSQVSPWHQGTIFSGWWAKYQCWDRDKLLLSEYEWIDLAGIYCNTHFC